MGSSRLPGKVLLKIENRSLLSILLERAKKAKSPDKIILATTELPSDDQIESFCINNEIECFRGSENDVLDRFYHAVKNIKPQYVIRVTGDCPLIDPCLIDQVVDVCQNSKADYGTNTLNELFPDGQDVEVIKFDALEIAWKDAKLNSEREHVTPYIRENSDYRKSKDFKFKSVNVNCNHDYSTIRMTVDEPKDFDLIQKLIRDLGTNKTWMEYTDYIIKNKLGEINAGIKRNEGYYKSLENEK
jgi:glutamate-1-semialdehyde 2,1-aminomutase/spore coat polysaccharide biosynthesis protein SpsF